MKSALSRLARHSLIYGIGSSLGIAGSFLLIPLYTHALSTAEYGALELLYRTSDVLILIMFMGVRQAYIRFYFDKRDDESWHRTVTGTTVLVVLVSCALVTILFLPFRNLVMNRLLQGSVGDAVFLTVLAWIPFEMLLNVGLTYFQIRTQSITYVTINFLRLAFFIGLNLVFLLLLHYGVIGVFLAQLAVAGGIAAAIMGYLLYKRRMQVSLPLIREMIKYGLPYLPATFFMYIVSNADRYFLGIFGSLDAVGVYALAAKIGMIGIMFLMDPFLKVWSPFLFEHYHRPDGPATLSRVLTLFTLASVTMALGVSVLAPVVLPLITGSNFHAAFPLVPIVSLAAVFYSMAHLADAGILISKKTHYKPLIFGIAAAVALLANSVLTRYFGVWGAAVSSVLALFTLLFVNHRISSRFYQFPIELKRLVVIFLAAIATYLVSAGLLRYGGVALQAKIESVVALLLFPASLWIGRFFTTGEREMIVKLLQMRRGRIEGVS